MLRHFAGSETESSWLPKRKAIIGPVDSWLSPFVLHHSVSQRTRIPALAKKQSFWPVAGIDPLSDTDSARHYSSGRWIVRDEKDMIRIRGESKAIETGKKVNGEYCHRVKE